MYVYIYMFIYIFVMHLGQSPGIDNLHLCYARSLFAALLAVQHVGSRQLAGQSA